MKNKMILFALCLMCLSFASCGSDTGNNEVLPTEPSTSAESGPASLPAEDSQPAQTEAAQTETAAPDTTDAVQPDTTEAALTEATEAVQPDTAGDAPDEQSTGDTDTLTENQALDAIKEYCFRNNPGLKDMADSDEYTIYWGVSTNESNEIVVLYRSYTGALTRYYIDPVSGEAYVTEQVPGIIDEEQRTEETLNVRDYLS